MTVIGNSDFENCASLRTIIFRGDAPLRKKRMVLVADQGTYGHYL